MKTFPIDANRLKVLVVGEPKASMTREGQPSLDRDTNVPIWNIDVTLIGDRAETIQLQVPEGGFPKGLGIGAMVVPDLMAAILWEKTDGRHGVMYKARSLKVEGGSAGLTGKASA